MNKWKIKTTIITQWTGANFFPYFFSFSTFCIIFNSLFLFCHFNSLLIISMVLCIYKCTRKQWKNKTKKHDIKNVQYHFCSEDNLCIVVVVIVFFPFAYNIFLYLSFLFCHLFSSFFLQLLLVVLLLFAPHTILYFLLLFRFLLSFFVVFALLLCCICISSSSRSSNISSHCDYCSLIMFVNFLFLLFSILVI